MPLKLGLTQPLFWVQHLPQLCFGFLNSNVSPSPSVRHFNLRLLALACYFSFLIGEHLASFPFLPAKLAPWISCLLPLAGILWCFGLFCFFVRALCCAANQTLSSEHVHLWPCRGVGLAQTSHQWVNPSPDSFRAAMDGPVLHSHRWALLGVLFSKATLEQRLLSHFRQRSLTTVSKRVSPSRVVSGAPSSAPAPPSLLLHSWQLCWDMSGLQDPSVRWWEIRSQPTPQLTVLPGCELCQGNTFGVAMPGTCPPQPLLPDSWHIIPRAPVSASGF